MKQPHVKDIVNIYSTKNILGVKQYLNQEDMHIDPSTWCGYIKKLIDNKEYITAKAAIELIGYKLLNIK
jgi:hypothetical protein